MTLAMTLIAFDVSKDYLSGLGLVRDHALVTLLEPLHALGLALLNFLPTLRCGKDIGRPSLLNVFALPQGSSQDVLLPLLEVLEPIRMISTLRTERFAVQDRTQGVCVSHVYKFPQEKITVKFMKFILF